jgi:hypothetical protein
MQRTSIAIARLKAHIDRPLDLIALCALTASGFVATPTNAQQAASGLPATTPTNPALTSQLQTPPQSASGVTYGQSTEQPATVTYTAGRLSVTANDSSLNQILRAISRATGMKITGGITDERVFGNYGPDNPAKVLSALLDGTSSNMLIIQTTAPGTPIELVLSPRNGGPTPPDPHPQPFDNAPRTSQPVRPSYPIAEPTPPPATTPNPTAVTPGAAIGGPAPSTDSNNSTDQQSPNGVRTPQQIYEQLQQIRQQQQQQQQQNKP